MEEELEMGEVSHLLICYMMITMVGYCAQPTVISPASLLWGLEQVLNRA
ncbi:Uncharacterised protein [Chlamydia trachomatis]|nr:Uncharacterised protein [Chlamydia trachomatis]